MNKGLLTILIASILIIGGLGGGYYYYTNNVKVVENVEIVAANETVEEEVVEVVNETVEEEPKEFCGDGECNLNETSCSCVEDCGTCDGIAGTCRQFSCVLGSCQNISIELCCGNGVCETGETSSSCEVDCPTMDLGDYPDPFVSGTKYESYRIIGVDGTSIDTVALSSIQSGLGATGARGGYPDTVSFDNEVSSLNNKNAIIIGHPCNNEWVNKLLGNNPDCNMSAPTGKGLIKLFKTGEDTLALVVTGDSPQNIRDAAEVLEKYDNYNLKGNEYVVS